MERAEGGRGLKVDQSVIKHPLPPIITQRVGCQCWLSVGMPVRITISTAYQVAGKMGTTCVRYTGSNEELVTCRR